MLKADCDAAAMSGKVTDEMKYLCYDHYRDDVWNRSATAIVLYIALSITLFVLACIVLYNKFTNYNATSFLQRRIVEEVQKFNFDATAASAIATSVTTNGILKSIIHFLLSLLDIQQTKVTYGRVVRVVTTLFNFKEVDVQSKYEAIIAHHNAEYPSDDVKNIAELTSEEKAAVQRVVKDIAGLSSKIGVSSAFVQYIEKFNVQGYDKVDNTFVRNFIDNVKNNTFSRFEAASVAKTRLDSYLKNNSYSSLWFVYMLMIIANIVLAPLYYYKPIVLNVASSTLLILYMFYLIRLYSIGTMRASWSESFMVLNLVALMMTSFFINVSYEIAEMATRGKELRESNQFIELDDGSALVIFRNLENVPSSTITLPSGYNILFRNHLNPEKIDLIFDTNTNTNTNSAR